ncbi:MAG: chemotaxis protein CheB [Thermodesulfobacteriota bacterium]
MSGPENLSPEPTADPQAARPQEDPTAAAEARDRQEETPPGRTPPAPAEEEPQIREYQAFPVVGIGASAGGLEPLEAFFSNLPTGRPHVPDMAFVVIQHLSPQHKSMVGQILKKDTDLPIQEIHDGMKVEPNTIYFNQPDKEVGLYQGVFHLLKPAEARHARMPIDFFFRSLAQDLEEKAVCIVLSGTGSDGTLGLGAVKAAGGMTMAQAEEQAKYPFMPRSAIDTGLVDYILPVEQMPEELIRYVQHPYLDETRKKALPGDQHYQNFLHKILMLVRSTTRHDFKHYKQTTVRRRISRRLAVHKIEDIADYFRYLQQNPGEIQALFKDLIICVTSFFRDPEAFQALETKVIPEILRQKPEESAIRVWVPGCGTGEEALSIAILFDEAMERAGQHPLVQIFATDIDAEAIDKARQGEYPESIAADVSLQRLQKYFVKKNGSYRIKDRIREMVIYAVQNVISDPPFTRLDLISCRNLLIYLNIDLQSKLLPMFHFSLKSGGYLFLGSSESIGASQDLFATVDRKWKLYQRKDTSHHRLGEYPGLDRLPAAAIRVHHEEEAPREVNVRHFMERLVLEEFAPASILINNRFEVLYLQGHIEKFLRMPKGEPSYNFFDLAQEDLRPKLLTVVHQAVNNKKKITAESVPFRNPQGGIGYLDLTVRPLTAPGTANLFLVVFDERQPPFPCEKKKGKAKAEAREDSRVAVLEHELQATKEYLQTTVEELEASNEELKSTNEELQSTNEELQSTNEELETAKEELHSTNEELITVNSELNNKVDELTEVNNDINNLLASTEIGTIFLDRDLKIKRYTPAATRLYNLIPPDVGRSIKDIAPRTEYKDFWKDAEEVLQTLQVKEREMQTLSGEVYAARILPYRTRQNVIEGVVLTFIDISAQAMARNFAQGIVDTVREPLLVLDGDLQVLSANQAFYRTFDTSREETENRRIYELDNNQWDIPRLKELLEDIIPENTSFQDFEVEHTFPRVGHKVMLLNARRLESKGRQPYLILLALEDITDRRHSA